MDFQHPVESVFPGTQGRILTVLARADAEFNMRTLAMLADISAGQVSRVIPNLVELGLVSRRDIGPSSLFSLVRTNIAAQAILALFNSHSAVLQELESLCSTTQLNATSVVIFGSFARGRANAQSDIDVVIVRPDDTDEDDQLWGTPFQLWQNEAALISGNEIGVIEVTRNEIHQKLNSEVPLWTNVFAEGIVISGESLLNLRRLPNG